MTWADALTGCAGYTQAGLLAGDWRCPPSGELMLIWVMLPSTGFTFETSLRLLVEHHELAVCVGAEFLGRNHRRI